ncbi:MAG: hypothetical protein Q4B43_10675 [Bacteroidota bacterium]|nr:hypothetical protein [Bacteroidota bacterium]
MAVGSKVRTAEYVNIRSVIYQNATPPPKYVIVESKYGSSKLNKKTGQMGNDWLEDRIKKQFGGKDPKKMKDILDSLRNGEVDRVLSEIDTNGNVTTYKLDELARVVGKWK